MFRNKLALVFILAVLGTSILIGCNACRQDGNHKPRFKIGVVLPLTGATARYGKWIKNALELAREEENADPQAKYELTYIVEDDAGEAGKAVSATQKLINVDKVHVIFGTWSSGGVLAMAPIVESEKVVLMADAVSPRIREAGDWVFRCVPDARLSLEVLEQPIKASVHKKLAIVYINNDFGKDLADYLEKLIGQGPPSVVFKEGYMPGTTDFRTLIEKLKVQRADSLFIAGYVEQGTLMKQAKELGVAFPIYASPSFENQDILDQAGNAAEGVVFPSYFDPASNVQSMRAFLANYRSRYGEEAEGFGASAYAGMKTLAGAINRCDQVESECVRRTLNDIGTFQSVFGETRIDDTGDLRYPIFLKTVRDGGFVRK